MNGLNTPYGHSPDSHAIIGAGRSRPVADSSLDCDNTPTYPSERPSLVPPGMSQNIATAHGNRTRSFGRPRATTAPTSSSPLLGQPDSSSPTPSAETNQSLFRFRSRYTASFRLPKQRRPPLLVSLFRNPRRLIPLVAFTVAVVLLFTAFKTVPLGDGKNPDLDPRRPIRFKKSSFDWAGVSPRFPIRDKDRKPLPSGPSRNIRSVQYDFGPTYASDPATESRRLLVRNMFERAWKEYMARAWGHDNYRPITGTFEDSVGWGITVIESLSTLWIMNLRTEFHVAAAFAVELDLGRSLTSGIYTADLATKVLGGLLSAYELSGLNPLLLKAKEVGELLYLAFDTPTHLPAAYLAFQAAKNGDLSLSSRTDTRILAVAVELTRLSQVTGDNRFYDVADRLTSHLANMQNTTRVPGLWPETMDFRAPDRNGDRFSNVFSAAGPAKGLFDALPSMYLITGGLEERYENMYLRAMDALDRSLLWRPMLPTNAEYLFPGTLYAHHDRLDLVAQATHSGCAVGATLAVGGHIFDNARHLALSHVLTDSCVWAHTEFPATSLLPQTFNMVRCPSAQHGCEWDEREWRDERRDARLKEGFTHVPDRAFTSAPETVKSLFYLWRTTGHKSIRNLTFSIFEQMRKETRVGLGYAGIEDVIAGTKSAADNEDAVGRIDLMEVSHFLFCLLSCRIRSSLFFLQPFCHPY